MLHRHVLLQPRHVRRLANLAIFGSETRNVSGDRHSSVPTGQNLFANHLVSGMNGWIEHHASDSEAILVAEKHTVTQTIPELQASSACFFSTDPSDHLGRVRQENLNSNHPLYTYDQQPLAQSTIGPSH